MRLPRAQRLALGRIHAEAASQLGAILSQALGKRLYVGLLGQRLCRFDEFIEPLPDPSFIFNFSMWSLGADNKRERRLGWAVFDIAMPIALDLLGTNKARSFTSADMTILRPTIRQFIANIKKAWSQEAHPIEIGDIQLKNRPQNINSISEDTQVAVVEMEIDLGSTAHALFFCYPLPLLDQLFCK
ncbi:MAG: flagellar motor switch protein FliM [Candidatus Latescibacterota bacterium]|jgi:flagellar motor switch protein FliM